MKDNRKAQVFADGDAKLTGVSNIRKGLHARLTVATAIGGNPDAVFNLIKSNIKRQISMKKRGMTGGNKFKPLIPTVSHERSSRKWHDLLPKKRLGVPACSTQLRDTSETITGKLISNAESTLS